MVQLKVLSGTQVGLTHSVEQFPCLLGRQSPSNLCFEESGIWDRHVELALHENGSFSLRSFPNASVAINGHNVEQAMLKNGDVIQFGGVKLQFWLAETQQHSLRLREIFSCIGFSAVCLAQVYVIYLLLQ
jgi:hypothetical protein